MKKILAGVIVLVSLMSNTVMPTMAVTIFDYGYGLNDKEQETKVEEFKPQDIGNLKGFSDIDQYDWAKEAIEDMSIGTYRGLFSGTTEPDAQGLALFSPGKKMTRAEFLTVVVRFLYPTQVANAQANPNEAWYQKYYNIAARNSLFNQFQFSSFGLEDPISREEMAYILNQACDQLGEETGELIDKRLIPDYNMIGASYRSHVVEVYTKGLITGVDDTGRFAPERTLTRAEAAIVLYRLANTSKRVNINDKQAITDDLNAPITIYEGQVRYNRNAKEGDTFVKKDGTQIILKKGPNGILGEGQGVAPDVGLLGQVTEKGCEGFTYKVADYGVWYDSVGTEIQNCLQNNDYWINKTTGEGYWSAECRILRNKYPAPDRDENPGSYVGQVSSDPYSLWVWGGSDWDVNFHRG